MTNICHAKDDEQSAQVTAQILRDVSGSIKVPYCNGKGYIPDFFWYRY
jgi:hypothetical protein